MNKIITTLGLCAMLGLAACGTDPGDRALSGAGIGAGVGAVGGALVGAPLAGAAIGGAAGAATGGLTMTTDILNWTLSAGSTAANSAAVMTTASAAARYSDAPALAVGNGSTSGTVEPGKLDTAPVLASSLAPMATEQAVAGEVHGTGTAGEPRLFPDPGVFGGDMEVTLRCDTPGATIHYTFDGSQPVATSPIYSAPIEVKGTELTIKAFASVPGKKDSAVVTGIYRIRD